MDPLGSETAYARQLQQGFRHLRFSAALEAQYQDELLLRMRPRVLWLAAVALVVWLGFSAFDAWRIDARDFDPLRQLTYDRLRELRLGVGGVIVGVILGTLRLPARSLRPLLTGLGVAMAFGTAASVYAYKALGVTEEASVLVVMMVALFLPLGLQLRTQIVVGVFFVVCVVAIGLQAAQPLVAEAMLRAAAVLTIALAVLAAGAYWGEYLQREQFLYRNDAQWLAMRDGLTGLHNRRMFTHQLDQAVRQAQREQRPLALVLIDLDHFKPYNDAHGHPAGDEVLRRLARVFERFATRPLDMAARLGGEEFALLLYDSTASHARASAQAVVHAVRQLALPHGASPVAAVVTISAGGALLQLGDTPHALYGRADDLLYQAKHSGRDRCCFEGAPEVGRTAVTPAPGPGGAAVSGT
jgi:diguanylate cyclase (GGDEF)-like protein